MNTDKVLPPVKKARARQNQAQRTRARPHALTRRRRRAEDEGRTKYHRSCSRTPRPMHNHIAPWQVSWLSGRRPLRPSRHQASGCQAADSPITVAGAATAWMERPSLCRSLFIPAAGQETARQSQYSGLGQPPRHAAHPSRASFVYFNAGLRNSRLMRYARLAPIDKRTRDTGLPPSNPPSRCATQQAFVPHPLRQASNGC